MVRRRFGRQHKRRSIRTLSMGVKQATSDDILLARSPKIAALNTKCECALSSPKAAVKRCTDLLPWRGLARSSSARAAVALQSFHPPTPCAPGSGFRPRAFAPSMPRCGQEVIADRHGGLRRQGGVVDRADRRRTPELWTPEFGVFHAYISQADLRRVAREAENHCRIAGSDPILGAPEPPSSHISPA